jgi:polyvinyl alcohol dehydrogenase (cytochrome)
LTRRRIISACVAASLVVATCVAAASKPGARCATPGWTSFGGGVEHSFSVGTGCSPISPSTVGTLVPAWVVHTTDSITASPAVADGMAYVGAWDGTFYAVDVATGKLRWTFEVRSHARSAFGRIVSSATVEPYRDPVTKRMRQVVLFGGGSNLWALDGRTGKELATIDLDPRDPAVRHEQDISDDPPVAEIESSPAVATVDGVRRIFVGIDVHNQAHVGRTGLVSVRLVPGAHGWKFRPLWKYDVETARTYDGTDGLTLGSGQGWGCGGVWSSPAVDEQTGIVAFGTASCDYPDKAYDAHENFAESMVALQADSGKLIWRYRPADDLPDRDARIADAHRDADFGASPNIFTLGDQRVVGEGRKSADYVVRDLRTGAKVSVTHVGQEGGLSDGFGVGGFLGTPAVESSNNGTVQVVGATAIPVPHSPGDLDQTTWAVRGFNPKSGHVNWTYRLAGPSYAHTSIVNGVAFVPDTTNSSLIAIDTASGLPLWESPVLGPPSSTAVVDGSTVIVGTGTRESDLEYKAFSSTMEDALASVTGASPLSPVSAIQAFRLATG